MIINIVTLFMGSWNPEIQRWDCLDKIPPFNLQVFIHRNKQVVDKNSMNSWTDFAYFQNARKHEETLLL